MAHTVPPAEGGEKNYKKKNKNCGHRVGHFNTDKKGGTNRKRKTEGGKKRRVGGGGGNKKKKKKKKKSGYVALSIIEYTKGYEHSTVAS